jgi:multidrug efflux pump subunit AcrA (membrane-fusion protein)
MKKNQIILLSLFLVITALIYWRVASNKKIATKEGKEAQTTQYVPFSIVKNQNRTLKVSSYGQIAPYTELEVSFEVQGRLEKGDGSLKPGAKFSFNQLLYKVNSEEAYYTLSSRKAQLSNLIIAILPDIELDFSSEKNKWNNFLNDISPSKTLPDFPKFSSNKEKMFITAKGILTDYMSIKSLEARMAKYIFLAPFDGTVIEVYAEPGATVNPGVRIAKIAKTGDMEVKVPIALSQLRDFKKLGKASFIDAQGVEIGNGNIVRISEIINQKTQSVDVYYSIKAVNGEQLFSGQFVTVEIDQANTQSSFTIPRMAVNDNAVSVLVGSKLEKRYITVVGSKPDSLFVNGLKNGEKVVLETVEISKQIKKYLGVKRD